LVGIWVTPFTFFDVQLASGLAITMPTCRP
jgi:hypothetical protein